MLGHALIVEAGRPTPRACEGTLVARILGMAAFLPEGDPLRALADATLLELPA